MSTYTRQQIQSLIARTKKRNNASKSPSPQLSPKQPKIKRTNSPTSIQSNSSKDLTLRYQQLHSKYKQLLQQVKDKNHKFQLQQMQIGRLKSERQRDQKQLFRLRTIIGFIKKQDYGLQVNMDMQSGGSWNTKIEKSTAVEYQHDIQPSYSTATKMYQNPSNFVKKYIKSPPKQTNMPLYSQNLSNNRSAKTIQIKDEVQQDSHYYRAKAESIYSPKTNQKQLSTIYKLKQSRQVDNKGNKLSNSPYSRLRFSRNFT